MTIVNRVSTFALHQSTVNDFSRVQQQLAVLQDQISSGFKTHRFDALTGETEQFVDLEAEIHKLTNYETNNAEAISRFRTQRIATEEMISVVDEMENLMARRNDADKDEIAFVQQMRSLRESFARELNVNLGGRFLFGGTRTNVPPVIVGSIPNPVDAQVPDDNYYQGSKENVVMRPRNNLEIEFEIRADNAAFQKIMGAAALTIEGHQEDERFKLDAAFAMMRDGLDDLISLQSQVDSEIINLENINERHESLRFYLKGVSEEIIKTDILTASTQVAVNETILQGTFQVFSRLNSLRLVDFLR